MYLVWSGNCADQIQKLHQKYGPVVKTSPNHILLPNPNAMFEIYSAGSVYKKVGHHSLGYSP